LLNSLSLTKPSKFSSHDTINSWLAILNLTQGKKGTLNNFNICPALCHAVQYCSPTRHQVHRFTRHKKYK
jgi:hypothetical protein